MNSPKRGCWCCFTDSCRLGCSTTITLQEVSVWVEANPGNPKSCECKIRLFPVIFPWNPLNCFFVPFFFWFGLATNACKNASFWWVKAPPRIVAGSSRDPQVTGGSDGTDVLTSMEVFNTKKQSWEDRKWMFFLLSVLSDLKGTTSGSDQTLILFKHISPLGKPTGFATENGP